MFIVASLHYCSGRILTNGWTMLCKGAIPSPVMNGTIRHIRRVTEILRITCHLTARLQHAKTADALIIVAATVASMPGTHMSSDEECCHICVALFKRA
eukprot:6206687-Pleurochrysis_carterae.AAC.3